MPESKTMISMKLPKKKATEMASPSYEKPEYPYGLSISFSKETLVKLGYSADDFKLGGVLSFSAKATVDSTSKSANTHGRDNENVGLQITDIQVTDMKGEKKTRKAAKKMAKGMSYAPAASMSVNPGKHTY